MYTANMALTNKDISLIKEALQPEFTKVKSELITELKKELNFLGERIEQRIQLSEKNIIETQGELHQNHEVRIRRLEKVTHLS
jgi:hypothetical protein